MSFHSREPQAQLSSRGAFFFVWKPRREPSAAEAKPVTLVVLYGPPAAGKGAAKKDIGTFIGANVEQNFEDWLDDIGYIFPEDSPDEPTMLDNMGGDTNGKGWDCSMFEITRPEDNE